MTSRFAIPASILVTSLALSCAPPADAVLRSTIVNAVGACSGALPVFESSLRKRPLGILNEGAQRIFVSCTLPVDQVNSSGNTFVGLAIINRSNFTASVSCTFVDGTAPEVVSATPPTYRTRSLTVVPGTGPTIAWDAAEFGLVAFSEIASFSCLLPPRVEIAAVVALWDQP